MKTVVIIVNILALILGLLSIYAAFMSPMLFDAPGSEKNKFLWLSAYSMMALPFVILVCEIVSWILFGRGNYRTALLATLVPIGINVALIILGFLLSSKG